MKTILIIAAAVVAASSPATAVAQQLSGSATIAVAYSDLDLSTEAGRRTLESRIDGAVRGVCGSQPNGDLEERADHQRCLRQAKTDSLAQAQLAIARATSGASVTVLATR